MKNRLQFNRHYAEYQTREEALSAFRERLTDPDFIPLIGEPVVLRYKDADDNLQLILAIGKKAGRSLDEREYHFIDTAEINENLAEQIKALEELDAETIKSIFFDGQEAVVTSGVAKIDVSANTIPVGEDYETHVIPENPEGRPHPIHRSYSTTDAIKQLDINMLDIATKCDEKISEMSASTADLSGNTVAGFDQINSNLGELSSATVAFSAATDEQLNNIKIGAGLEPDGTYEHAHDAKYIDDASSLFEADTILDKTLWELSANTISANQAIQEQISELANREISGKDALVAETDNGNTEVSLKISDEDNVLTQNVYGLKANLSLTYDSNEKKIYLKGKEGQTISEINAADFIKDGMLDSVSIFTATEEDHREHPELVPGEVYLRLVFNTDAGKSDVFISVKKLVDIYTVSATSLDYLTIDGYEIRANVDVENGLASKNSVDHVSVVTENIIKAAGLDSGEEGKYPGHDETHYIKDADSLDNADVLLDAALWSLSGVVADLGDMSELEEKIDRLSGVTREFSAATTAQIMELSARTFDPTEIYEYVDESIVNLSGDVITYVDELLSGITGDIINEIRGDISGITMSIEELSATVMSDELVTAAALNDLNRRILDAVQELQGISVVSGIVSDLSGATYNEFNQFNEEINNLYEVLSGVTSDFNDLADILANLSASTVQLSSVTVSNSEDITELSGACVSMSGQIETNRNDIANLETEIINNERVISEALNNLNRRVVSVSGDVKDLSDKAITGVTVDGVPVAVSNNVVNLQFDVPTVNNFFDGVIYDSNAKRINFYNGSDVKAYVDATDFIKDGMVSNVYVDYSANTLVIEFNTDAGKSPISIPLNDIFDPTNYYTKSEIDALSASVVTNKTNISELSATTVLLSANTHNEIQELSASVVTNKTNVNNLSGSVVVNEANIDILSATLQTDEFVISAALNDLNNRINILSSASPDLSVVTELSASVLDLSTRVGHDELVTSAALNDLNQRVAKVSGTSVDLSNYYTKQEVYNKTEIMELFSASGGNPDAAISALTEGLSQLSAATVNLSGNTTAISQNLNTLSGAVQNNYYTKNEINNGVSAYTKTLSGITEVLSGGLYTLSGYVASIQTGGTSGITGIKMNNSDVTVNNGVANLGTVITAETQLSTASTGTGNVVGSIAVSNHKITTTMFSAASADQIGKLSAATVSFSGSVVNNYYKKSDVYNKTEITELFTASGGNPDAAISALTQSLNELSSVTLTGVSVNGTKVAVEDHVALLTNVLTAETPLSKSVSGNGNVFTDIEVSGHGIVMNLGMTVASSADTYNAINALSGGVVNNYYKKNEVVLSAQTSLSANTSLSAITSLSANTALSAQTSGIALKTVSSLTVNMLDATGGTASTITFDGSENRAVNVPANTDTATTETGHYNPTATSTTVGNADGFIKQIKLDSKRHVIEVVSGITSWPDSAVTAVSAQTSYSAVTASNAGSAGRLDHNVTLNLSGDTFGNVTTDFSGSSIAIRTYKEFTTANSLTNMPLNKFLTVVEISGGTLSMSFGTLPEIENGEVRETHFIIKNTGSTDAIISAFTASSGTVVVVPSAGNMYVDHGEIGEVNALVTKSGGTYTIYVITT